jgi:hypothetical protein
MTKAKETLERPDHTKLELTLLMRINQGLLDCEGPVPSHRLHVPQDTVYHCTSVRHIWIIDGLIIQDVRTPKLSARPLSSVISIVARIFYYFH